MSIVNIMKRIISGVLIIILLLSLLVACKNNEENNNSSSTNMDDYIYLPKLISLPNDIGRISNMVYSSEKLYFSTEITVNRVTFECTVKLYSINIDGTELTELSGYTTHNSGQDYISNTSITALSVDEDGNLWISESVQRYRFDTPEDFDWDYEDDINDLCLYHREIGFDSYLRKLDATGGELISIDINTVSGINRSLTIMGVELDNVGNIVLSTTVDMFSASDVYTLSENGDLIFQIDPDSISQVDLIRTSDRNVAVSSKSRTDNYVRVIDVTNKTWGDQFIIPNYAEAVFSGNDDFVFLYHDNTNLYGYCNDLKDFLILLNWVDSRIYDSIENICIMPDGRIFVVTSHWEMDERRYELFLLSQTHRDEIPEKTHLTLAVFTLDFMLHDAVIEFNKSNELYQIDIVDYYDETLDDLGLSRLSTEIIAGRVPDILDVRTLPYRHYAMQGLFEDLYTFLDSDPELNRNDIVSSILSSSEVDGSLYKIFPFFTISSIVGSSSVVGLDNGWTADEFLATIEANPQADIPLGQMSKENFIDLLISLSINDYINWDKGETYFDSDSFIRLLEFANTFPANENMIYNPDISEHPPDSIISGREILLFDNFRDYLWIQVVQAVFDSEITFKGFPTESRNGHAFNTYFSLAILSTCVDKDGAWEFLRTLLTKNYQMNYFLGLPTNNAALYEVLTNHPYYGQENGWNDLTITTKVPSQAEIEQFLSFVNTIDRISNQEEALKNIVLEGTSDFFNGRNTAQDAARIIQSRASTYVSEQSR